MEILVFIRGAVQVNGPLYYNANDLADYFGLAIIFTTIPLMPNTTVLSSKRFDDSANDQRMHNHKRAAQVPLLSIWLRSLQTVLY